MEFRVSTLEELSPEELVKLIRPGLKVCDTDEERDKFAKAMLDVARDQIDAAIYLNDLWGEFEYLEAGRIIGKVISEHLYSTDLPTFE